jgi:predicted RNase H-like HicB family nuclease
MSREKQPYVITLPPEREGGRYIIAYPDLPGCISDGATLREAIRRAAALRTLLKHDCDGLLASRQRVYRGEC